MITQPSTPVLVDAFIVEFNEKIVAPELLPWLNNPLGKVQSITKKLEGSLVTYPAMHQDSGEYTEVFPNDKLTNYSWFVFGDEEYGDTRPRAKIKVPATINFFLNLNQVYPAVTQSRDLENAKLEIVNALYNICMKSGAIRISSVSESFGDVYAGFGLASIQDKYFMQPYAGLSFEVDLYIKNLQLICSSSSPVPPTEFKSTDVPGVDIPDSFVPDGTEKMTEA